ncbi:MAG: hypothetical protein R2838_11975 [Caldilineaceae bacterium]
MPRQSSKISFSGCMNASAETRLVLQVRFQPVGDVDPGFLALAAHDDVHIRLLAALLGQHAHMRAAEHNRAVVHFLDGTGRPPCLLDLRRVGGDAHEMGAEFLNELRHRLLFDIRVKDDHLVAARFTHRGQVGQSQVGRGAGIDGETKFWIDQYDTHRLSLLNPRVNCVDKSRFDSTTGPE